MMIVFISPYPPIVCGLGSYVYYLTHEIPRDRWKVLSFNPFTYGPLIQENSLITLKDHVLYAIPSRTCVPTVISNGLKQLIGGEDAVIWMQHSFGIWKDTHYFHQILKYLKDNGYATIVTHHTLHFQSSETPYGLTRREYELLEGELPHVHGVTVFSRYIKETIKRAFPKHRGKLIAVIRHGAPLYPKISEEKAKEKLFYYLVQEADLDGKELENLERLSESFFDTTNTIIGSIGFISPTKGSDIIYSSAYVLQKMLPEKDILAMYIGSVRDLESRDQIKHLEKLKSMHDGVKNFFFNLYIPESKLSFCLKALDVNVFWRQDCTQSGMLSHAQGVGAIVVGRNLETLGETLKMSGYPAPETPEELLLDMKRVIRNQELRKLIMKSAREYAKKYSWKNQALKHCKLADAIFSGEEVLFLD